MYMSVMAAASESKYVITKLNGSNYFNWRYKIEMLLKEKGVWTAIIDETPKSKTKEWIREDEKAHSTIALSIDDDQIQHIRNCKSAKEAWNALKEFHEKDTPGNRVHVLRMIMRQKCDEGADVQEHVNKMNELFQKLLALSDEIKPEFFMSVTLLGSLPESYDGLITALEARSEEELSSSLVMSKLIAEYKRRLDRKDTKEETALKVTNANKKCYFCKSVGHLKMHCEKYKAWKRSKQRQNKDHKANFVNNDSEGEFLFAMYKSDGWIVDSGATCHIASKREYFVEFNDNHHEKVRVANGEEIISEGKGTVQVKVMNAFNVERVVKMQDVLYMPSIGCNLISVKCLTRKGYKVTFDCQKCEIWSINRKTQIAVADICGKLYKLRVPNNAYLLNNISDLCVHKWHDILGHRAIDVVKTMDSSGLVNGIKIDKCGPDCTSKQNCEVCLQGKMTRIKFPQESKYRSKKILELIHSDVCGPMRTETPSGKKYILTFIDDFSRYTTIYLLRNKSEVFEKLKHFVEMCKTQFGHKIKCIRSDRGGEYVADKCVKYMQSEGIQFQRTAPYSPQQNGVAERKNRTLIEMARCMLIEANLTHMYWGEAVTMANYIQNRLPTKAISKTPYEHWNGKIPNIGHFKQFGAKCYVHIPDEKRHKLQPKSLQAILVGYDLYSKAYRCYIPKTKKVVISRDVKFVEKDNDWKSDEASDNKEQPESTVTFEFGNENYKTDAEIRKSTRISVPPEHFTAGVNILIQEPRNYNEAVSCTDKHEWIVAMEDEIKSLHENHTWDLVEKPNNRTSIGCKWVFKVKTDIRGKPIRYKARLVAQGFNQKYGIDFDRVFAPVVRQTTFRILLTCAATRQMKVMHYDAKTAFLNGILKENIYMRQPPGFITEGKEHHVCLLRRSIYGLKQSARVWNEAIHNVLINANYKQSKNDQCLYSMDNNGEQCYVLIYVDDLIVASKCSELIRNFEKTLLANFQINNLGEVKNYLGLQVIKDSSGSYSLNQTAYIEKIVTEFGLADAKTSDIPISVGYGKSNEMELLPNNENYRKLVGCLLYISVNTRPDISASISILAQKVNNPSQEDWGELKRTLKYLKGTSKMLLQLGRTDSQQTLVGYADANWAEDRTSRKSNSGYVFQFAEGTISWTCKRQTCVALSSTEAEFIALSEACKEALWIRRVLHDFHYDLKKPTTIFEDNQSCLRQIQEEKFSDRSKHIDTRFFYVKDHIEKEDVECCYCPTEEMLADLCTKPLPAKRLQKLRKACGMQIN